MKKMNILILFTQPWKTGGAETHVEALLKGLCTHKVFLAVNHGSDEFKLAKLKEKYNIEIIMIQARGANFLKWKKSFEMLKQIIRENNIEIISAQQRTAGIWAWLLSKDVNIKYTVTMHDPWHRAKFKKIYAKIFPQMIVVSENLAQVLYNEYGFTKDKVNLINNGVDFTFFKPMNKLIARRSLLLDNEKMILHVSRMSSVKGAVSLVIIDALEALANANIFYKLVIIGEGPFRKKIEDRADRFNQKYGNWIEVKNFVEDISLWYNATDILIGEGRVAIETLACEKPVVAIRNDKYFIGLITKDNIEYACKVNFDGKDKKVNKVSMAEEISKAFKLSDVDSRDIALYVKQHLSIDKMVIKYIEIFNKL